MTEDVTRFDAGFFNLPADVASVCLSKLGPSIEFLRLII
jgi:hypothetical protein